MKVLIACEESQVVCKAFRNKGHEAFSCDIQECSGGHPEWHIQGDVLKVLNPSKLNLLMTGTPTGIPKEDCVVKEWRGISFFTMDGVYHEFEGRWDLIIAHPPCTRLCNSGQRWLYWGDDKYKSEKISEQQKAIVFFMTIALADCDKIVIENPNGIMSTAYRKPDCTYNPYDFEGETECKKTCLWLKGVEPLKPTRKIPLKKEERTQGIWKGHFDGKTYAWNSPECARMRSRTPLGVGAAFAEQWG